MAQARGDLAAAEQAFTQSLAISEQLAGLDPTNTGWQQGLAVAHSRVGDVAQARGDLAAAEQAFTQSLAISEQLAGLDPANTGWQRDLAVAYSRVGDVAQARGDLAAAEQAFTQSLAISEQLAGLDPANTGWQRDWRSRTAGSVTWRRLVATWRRRSRRSPSPWPSPSDWPGWIPPTLAGSGTWLPRTARSMACRAVILGGLWMKILRRLCR